MYLCPVREAAGVETFNLSETLSGFQGVLDSMGATACRSRIEALMEKYKRFYIDEKSGVLDTRYEQQHQVLVDVFVSTSARNTRGAKKAEAKVFRLLKENRVDAFRQKIVTFVQSVEEEVNCFSVLVYYAAV